jgi:hypothetical protein
MPRDEDGIIHPQENCRSCDQLRDCLQTAIAVSGGPEKLKYDRTSEDQKANEPGGIVGAILRWSKRKHAAQKGGGV